jgi:outer membrane protein assembly factor BamB
VKQSPPPLPPRRFEISAEPHITVLRRALAAAAREQATSESESDAVGAQTPAPVRQREEHEPDSVGTPASGLRRRSPRLLAVLALAVLLIGAASACYSIASPEGWADPIFAGNTIYLSANRGQLEAYDRSTQKVLWQFPSSQDKQTKLDGIYSTPVLDPNGSTLYFGAYNGNVYSLDATTGQMHWGFNTGSALIGGILLKNGALYVGNSDGRFLALQASNGQKLWEKQAGKRVWSTPIDAGSMVVVTSMDSDVYAFNAQNGNLAWKSTVASAAVASTPSLDGTTLTFGAFDKHFYAVRENNGAQIWQSPAGGNWFWTRGLVSGDNLYAGNLDGYLYAFDSNSGALRWRVNLGAPVRSAPALANGVLVVAARNGMIHGLDPASGKDKWPAINAGGNVLANLVQNDTGLYALTEAGTHGGGRLLQIDATNGTTTSVIGP